MKTVGELDEDDANIARHREQHLAEVLGLGVLESVELDLVELRHAVDELGYGIAEVPRDLGLGDFGIFGYVVKQSCGKRLRIEVPLREDVGDGERVRNVGLTGLPELPFVGRFAEVVSGFELSKILRFEIPGPFLEQRGSLSHMR